VVALADALTAVLLATVAVSFAAGLLAWRERDEPGALALVLLLAGVVWWAGLLVFELQADSLPRKALWSDVQWVGVVAIPVAWLLFALEYTGRDEYVTRGLLAALAVVPGVTIVLAATSGHHDLLYAETTVTRYGDLLLLDRRGGPWYWVTAAFTYLLGVLGFVPLLNLVRSKAELFRGQGAALLLGLVAPWATNVLHVAGMLPVAGFDPTPVAFAVTGVAFLGALQRFQLFGASPAPNWRARRLVFERMDDAAVVVDTHGYVVDANESAEALLGRGRRDAIGDPVSELLPSLGPLDADERPEYVTVDADGRQTPYDVSVTVIRDVSDRVIGRVATFHDVSQYFRQRQRLSVLNRVFRHNVRTDTQMILGYADQLNPDTDEEDEARDIVKQRASHIADVGEKARVIVDLLEREQYAHQPVDVGEILADRVHRLREQFPDVTVDAAEPSTAASVPAAVGPVVWNVLENAAEHNTDPDPRVDVSVDVREDRVAVRVADNGPGLDDHEYEAVERAAETQLDHGSGLGLWLIRWGAEVAGGRVKYEDNDPTGTVVTVDVARLD